MFFLLPSLSLSYIFFFSSPEQILVYQQVEKASTKGIWSRDLKNLTKLPLLSLTKALKTLETRQLIKSIRSISSKTKKLYILHGLTPDKSITGGPWYSSDSHEFDHEFVTELKNFIVMLVKNMKLADLDMIYEQVRVSGISKIELAIDELELVVNTLIYELRIEEVSILPSLLSFSLSPSANFISLIFFSLYFSRSKVLSSCSQITPLARKSIKLLALLLVTLTSSILLPLSN